MEFTKELRQYAAEWNAKRIALKVDPTKCKDYQKYMALKYEMLCQKMNEFNINK